MSDNLSISRAYDYIANLWLYNSLKSSVRKKSVIKFNRGQIFAKFLSDSFIKDNRKCLNTSFFILRLGHILTKTLFCCFVNKVHILKSFFNNSLKARQKTL